MIQENQNFELITGANTTKPKENHKEEEKLSPQEPEDASKSSSKIIEEQLNPQKPEDASKSSSKIIEEQLNPQQPEDVSKPSSKIMEEPLIPKSVKIEEEKSKDASESPSKIIAGLLDLKTLPPVNVKQNQQSQQPLERLTIPPQQPF